MNKQEFLKELGNDLAILEDREQQDILEEYSQHIDMELEKGQSEEEAIRDFGEIHDLAAEILEAYHVKPEYHSEVPREAVQSRQRAPEQGGSPSALSHVLKKCADSVKGFSTACFHVCGAAAGKLLRLLSAPWKKLRNSLDARRSARNDPDGGPQSSPAARKPRARAAEPALFGRACHTFSRFTADCFILLLRCALWCLRWLWNLFMISLALFSGLLTLTALYFLAIAIVWLFQGYPLTGITLAGLGAILCGGSFTFFCFSLIRRREKPATPYQETATEEVQHA